ncbi:hypothetical protein THAOC_28255 [Thalassiosira oceanica]|uniref:Mitochondrial inner membrane protease subunit n=1 Tax=Thalassiosira oceanica TaxID=159749 RepID=K0S0N9_THAOC|nr:hypothetical protein THAOC_28255 [Thalassiosira oceanica]|mmetsp:Transcript_9387/g.21475  ORF Transcript_9387/g.21475 Transcript_9387/m.21475 type:complete len:287 (-) Transcript_9387:27-887(-)|eukprot:EJK52462.1 hypothetical protein THAOC_28255 [Thalassiosira oceanica]
MSLRWAGCFLLLVFSLSPSSSSVGGVGVAEAFAYPMRHYRRPQIQISRSGTDRRKGSRLGMKGGRDDGNNSEDPNPGGMTSWDDDDDSKKKFSELSFFEQVQEWFASEEGKEDVRTYTTSLGIALLLRLLIIEPRYIPSLSMYPTFEVGDQLAVEKVTKRIRPLNRNEVVVFNPPTSFKEIVGDTSRKAKEALIKRIVATEGDKVEVMGGKLFVNGKEQDEPFTAEDAQYEFGPVLVPAGEVLVLGDNRNHSLDGHIWGFLPAENVIGRAVFVYWPPWRVGTTGMY